MLSQFHSVSIEVYRGLLHGSKPEGENFSGPRSKGLGFKEGFGDLGSLRFNPKPYLDPKEPTYLKGSLL